MQISLLAVQLRTVGELHLVDLDDSLRIQHFSLGPFRRVSHSIINVIIIVGMLLNYKYALICEITTRGRILANPYVDHIYIHVCGVYYNCRAS